MQQPSLLALSQHFPSKKRSRCWAGAGAGHGQGGRGGSSCLRGQCCVPTGDGCPRRPCWRAARTRSWALQQHFCAPPEDCKAWGGQRTAPASRCVPGAFPHGTTVTRHVAKASYCIHCCLQQPPPAAGSVGRQPWQKTPFCCLSRVSNSSSSSRAACPDPSQGCSHSAHPQTSLPHALELAGHRQKQTVGENVAKATAGWPPSRPPTHTCSPHADTSRPPGSTFPKGGKLLCCLISCCCLIPRAEKTSHSCVISSQVQTLILSPPGPGGAGTPRGSGPGRGTSRAAAPAARGMHHIRKARDHRRLPGTFPSPRARHALRSAAKEMNSHFLPCRRFS